MAQIEFTCKECNADMIVEIPKGKNMTKSVCLECGEPHIITIVIAHPKSSAQTYRNESWLAEQYTDLNRSMADIAQECAVSPMTIHKWLKTHGIETRSVGRRQ
jgi:hypothetical protein